jgi:hypothetical protein
MLLPFPLNVPLYFAVLFLRIVTFFISYLLNFASWGVSPGAKLVSDAVATVL